MSSNVVALAQELSSFVETPTARYILGKVRAAHKHGKIAAVVGAAGCGKTTALNYYASQSEHVYVVEMTEWHKAVSPAMRLIARTIGADSHHWGERWEMVCFVLRIQYGHRRLLIVDEAQHLENRALDLLRSISDETGCGLVLAGNPSIIHRLRKNRVVVPAFAQLDSRLAMRAEIKQSLPEDVIAICAHHGVADRRARATLTRYGMRSGGLRTVCNIITIARDIAGARPIAIEHVTQAIGFMELEETA